MTNKEIRRYAKITAAQKSFWHFQKALYPDFFTDDKAHLKTLSDTLQAIYEGKVKDADGTVTHQGADSITIVPPA